MNSQYMMHALELAKKGMGHVNPNPLVGALIVKNEKIISEGYHKYYGSFHAEVNAINNSKKDLLGATMYVTLEPCSHFGKTPPCTQAIINSGIKKVVIAMKDPNPLVSGKGIEILKNHGIEVITGIMEEEAKKLNEVFIKYISTNLPFCLMKTAMTLDGKIATYKGDSKWISNESSRKFVHELRHKFSAIMVGINTVIKDNPKLNTRLEKENIRHPIKIIIDSKARIPLDSNLFKLSHSKVIVATTKLADKNKLKSLKNMGVEIIITPIKNNRVDLKYLVKTLGKNNIDSILIEGGASLNYSALQEGIVDKVISFISPKIIGGETSKTPVGGKGIPLIKDAITLEDIEITQFENDLMVTGYMNPSS